MEHGTEKSDRTGTGTRSVFGYQARYDLRAGFPLLTTKKLATRSIFKELLWFLSGDTDVKTLQAQGVTIWDEWATAEQTARFGREAGDLGPVYGHQWRNFGATRNADGSFKKDGVDQILKLVEGIKKNPDSRRHIVTGWNPEEADQVALPPCHTLFQFYVADGARAGKPELSCQLYQRSADIFLGVPFNIASYALLTHLLAAETGLEPGEFVHSFGDVHLYVNHIPHARLQLTRQPRTLPNLSLAPPAAPLCAYRFADLVLEGYDPYPLIKAQVAV